MPTCRVGLDPVTGQAADIEEKNSYDVHAVYIYIRIGITPYQKLVI